MPNQNELIALFRLSTVPGIGPQRLRALVNHFGSAEAVFSATARSLTAVEGINRTLASLIAHYNGGERFAHEQFSRIKKNQCWICTLWNDKYPSLLKKIYDPPPFLFIRGEFEKADDYGLAIVGTRNPSEYGKSMTEKFSGEITRLGITIVSGLARGVDTIAHRIALQHSGRTLSVIGSGIDIIYPPENKSLAEKIIENGAIVSEYPMGTKPDAGNFPRRNRIISGLTLGTIIVETTETGGAMITASTALDQNREIFAIPGNLIENRSRGTNLLIKEGRATLVQSMDDILNILGTKLKPLTHKLVNTIPLPDLSFFEQKLFEAIPDEPVHIDFISRQLGLTISDVLVNLLSLEFKGIIKQLPGKMFKRTTA